MNGSVIISEASSCLRIQAQQFETPAQQFRELLQFDASRSTRLMVIASATE